MEQRHRAVAIAAGGMAGVLVVGALIVAASNGSAGTTADNGGQPSSYGESGLPTNEPSERGTGTTRNRTKIPRTFQVRTNDPVFFITVDDGNTKSRSALNFITKHRIPATVFLTDASVDGDWNYFREFASAGGSIENHTMTHSSLGSSDTSLQYEICRPQGIYQDRYGVRPTMLRPPYGNGGYSTTPTRTRKAIDRTATSCGIKHVVMWNALAEGGKFRFIRGSLKRGDIVLFHFTPSLAGELKAVMAMAKKKGLHPAPLTDYLK